MVPIRGQILGTGSGSLKEPHGCCLIRQQLDGEAVNIASRIESFAVPGGVMLSDAAYAPLQNRSDLEVVPLGRFKLKNVGRPFDLYAVAADGLVVPDSAALEGRATGPLSRATSPSPARSSWDGPPTSPRSSSLSASTGSSASSARAASARPGSWSSWDADSRPTFSTVSCSSR